MLRKLTMTFVAAVALCGALTTSAFAVAEFDTKDSCDDACRGTCFMVRGGDAWRCYWMAANPDSTRRTLRQRLEAPSRSHRTIPGDAQRR